MFMLRGDSKLLPSCVWLLMSHSRAVSSVVFQTQREKKLKGMERKFSILGLTFYFIKLTH
jgi:hypothetical protein